MLDEVEHVLIGMNSQSAGLGSEQPDAVIHRFHPEFVLNGLTHEFALREVLGFGGFGQCGPKLTGQANGECLPHRVRRCETGGVVSTVGRRCKSDWGPEV